MRDQLKQIDTKEFELPDTTFIRDIENRVFQSIALECLSKIQGIALIEGTLIDNLLGREAAERGKGIHIEQNQKDHSVHVKIEINVAYGVSIPEKAEEIQVKVVREISQFTGLHVGCVHVIFKNLISSKEEKRVLSRMQQEKNPSLSSLSIGEE